MQQEIQQAIDSAEEKMKSLGNPLDMFDHLYAEMPPYLQQQKKECTRHLEANGEEVEHG